jgi:aspartate/methionine/tyrosine aminotransferase
MSETLNPGEEVVLFEPYFMAYSDIVEYLGTKEVGVPLAEDAGYRLDLERLKENITSKTKMMVL